MVGKSKSIFPVLFIIGFYGVAIFINKDLIRPKIEISKQDSALNFNTNFLKFVSIGNRRFFADIIWVQTLLESDEIHYKKSDLNSWMFIRFKNIAELDPYFYQNYLWGGIYLSIIKDDRTGASEIFERGLKFYPDDYDLNYNAGFNYFAQLGNYPRAYDLLSKIQYHSKAPSFLPTLTAKIKFESNFNYDETILFLIEQLKITKDEMVSEKIKSNIYSLKAERDLDCLNQQKVDCEKTDAEGNSYVFKNGEYVSRRRYRPYRIHKRES